LLASCSTPATSRLIEKRMEENTENQIKGKVVIQKGKDEKVHARGRNLQRTDSPPELESHACLETAAVKKEKVEAWG